MQIDILEYALPLYTDPKQWTFFDGGRGGGKSYQFCLHLLADAMQNKTTVMNVREYQRTLRDSVHRVYVDLINDSNYGLQWNMNGNPKTPFWDIGQEYIRNANGSIFLFYGLQDMNSIKSIPNINRLFGEEAHSFTQRSIDVLIPTIIRNQGAKFFFAWNNDKPDDPIELLKNKIPDEISYKRHVTYKENPFMTRNKESMDLIELDKKNDYQKYEHVWLGAYNIKDHAIIFNDRYAVADFTPNPEIWHGEYYGMDFGFSQDPTALVKCWIHDKCLYIEQESGGVGIETNRIAPKFKSEFPEIDKNVIYGDSSRPETISYLSKHGLPLMRPCKKWAGSVEDGIEYIKSFNKIIIHPRCAETLKEFKNYSYKVDKKSGHVTTKIEDKNNHYIDAIRYALTPFIKSSQTYDYSALIS